MLSHTHVVGRTRSGKSKAIEGWVLQAIASGMGVGVVDPHGDLFSHLVAYLSLVATQKPQIAERLVIIDPLNPDWSVGFNPLELWPGEVAERKAKILCDVITHIFHDDPTVVVRMRRVMFYAFLALIELGLTLVELPRFLTDKAFRVSLLTSTHNKTLSDFWLFGFPQKGHEATEWTGSTLNRIEPLLNDPDFRLIFGQRKSTINLRSILDEGKTLLVNTSKGQLTDDASRLMGAFIVAQIQQAAMTRVELPEDARRDFWLALDEFQNYVSPTISTLLEESGKYKLYLLLAHQHLAQLTDEELLASVLSQCGERVCFAVGEEDAHVLARMMFRPELDQRKHSVIKPLNWGHEVVTAYEDITWRPQNEIWELEERKLFGLAPRYFWHKRLGERASLYKSFDLPTLPVPTGFARQLRDMSGSRFALPKDKARQLVESERIRELREIISQSELGAQASQPLLDFSNDEPPIWSD